MSKRIGSTFYNSELGRIDIYFDAGGYYDGLHCGECLEVRIDDKWIQTRIEKAERWYFVGLTGVDPTGLTVRI